MEAQVAAWVASFPYPAVFLLLVACGMGAPLSEDLILVTGGLVAARGHALLAGMALAGWIGTVCGDLLLFRMGRAVGAGLLARPRLQRILTPERVLRVQTQLARRGAVTVFAVRFLPGLRVPTYLLAGASRFPLRRFVLADALGALVTAPLLTYLGFRFGRDVLGPVRGGLRWVLGAAVVTALLLLAWRGIRHWRRLAT
ncbi:MAG: DedA family protein [Myxococcaceae bacterium]|nr:DedA family protein [Myxococcaceae bacterium]MCI0672236.1 DedA family protein [Myxococcaceae bacterium]